MVLVVCVIFSMQPAFVSAEGTNEETETRTMEEILNDYHQKSLEAALGGEKNTATYARSAGTGKTLEQETVEELTAAGYEAYNVTGDNYETLEKTLKTDFGSMGLDTDGSYVIVISGEEKETQNNNSRLGGNVIEQVGGTGEDGGGGEGFTSFTHTYNGVTYTMRNITITAADNSDQRMRNMINLYDDYGVEDVWEDLDIYVNIISSVSELTFVGTLYSWVSALLPEIAETDSQLQYCANTNWHIKYTQVCNVQTMEWVTSASTEFVTTSCSLIYMKFNSTTLIEEPQTIPGHTSTLYSEYYDNDTQMNDYAAFAFINNAIWRDTIDYVEHKFDGETVVEHYRDMYWNISLQ